MPNFFNDEYLSYNLSKHQYVMSVDGFELMTGEALMADHAVTFEQGTRMLERVSNIIYNYIYSWAKDKPRTQYEISLPQYREGLKQAMAEMMMAILANKTDPSLYFKNRKFTEVVSPQVRMILLNHKILFRGELKYIKDYDKGLGTEY